MAGSGGTENHLEMSGDESEQSMTRDITTYEELVHSSIPHVVAWPTGAHCSNLHLYTATGLIECCVEQHMQVQEALAKPGGMKYRNTIMSNFDVCGLFSEKNLSADCRRHSLSSTHCSERALATAFCGRFSRCVCCLCVICFFCRV